MKTDRLCAGTIGLLWFASAAAYAQTPQLVQDINQTADAGPGTDPWELTATLGALFYVGDDDANGRDVRRMDGTGAVSFLLDSLSVGGPTELTPSGPALSFVADKALYRTDGTPAGTSRVRSFGTFLHGLTHVNGLLFFMRTVPGAEELWRSDGTEAGTIPLGAARPETLTAAGGRLFFVRTTATAGQELWTSDGTVAGTRLVADICPGACSGVPLDRERVAAGGIVFFRGDDGVHGPELWRSDGTAGGTTMVQDSVPGSAGLHPSRLAALGGGVLFGTTSDGGLWFSDGSGEGTRRLRADLSAAATIHDAGGVAFFGASDRTGGNEEDGLWRSDGTPAGTQRVTSSCAPFCSLIDAYGTLAGTTVFGVDTLDGRELWRTDGTAAGTFRIADVGPEGPLERFDAHLYYRGFQHADGFELWRTDGTAGGTARITNRVESSSRPEPAASVGGRMFFAAERPDLGRELWSTTGTPESTSVLELSPGAASSFVTSAIGLGGNLVFGRYTGSGSLWKTDGTLAGTAPLRPELGVFGAFANGSGVAIFPGAGPSGGDTEPWRTDGTVGGTFPLADLAPGSASSAPGFLAPFRGRVAFSADGLAASVWISDGTREQTHRVTPRPCTALTPVDDKLFMSCGDAVTGQDVWVTDGTESGTRLVRDLPTPFVAELVGVEDHLYFRDGSGRLWRSDGTSAGTRRVEDLVGFPVGHLVRDLTALGGVLLYTAHTPATGLELWRTDGTPSGTFLLRDLWPGPDSGVGQGAGLVACGGRAVFAGYTPATGREPWQTDGTVAGTTPMQEIVPGPASSSPYRFAFAAGRVYFAANDNVRGFEPWTAVLPSAIAIGDAVVEEGDTGTRNAVFSVRLVPAASNPVVVRYTTVPDTAQAGTDYTPTRGALTFPPGAVSATVTVPVRGDVQDETDETFTVELSSAAPVGFADRRGLAMVLDDDSPRAAIAGGAVAEGHAGHTGAPFTVTLTTKDGRPAPTVKTVRFETVPGTATSGVDYVASSGTLTFAAGTPSGATLGGLVAVRGDTLDEPDEAFRVRLSPASDVLVPSAPATSVIRDDDGIASAPPVELAHGAVLRATLQPHGGAGSDRDWYALRQDPRASYELVVDETSGDAVPLQVERMAADGATVLQSAAAVGTGASVSLRWENTSPDFVGDQPIRIGSLACGTACGTDDGYRVRFYETTLSAPHVDNSGGHVTIVTIQNTSDRTVSGRVRMWTRYSLALSPVPFQLSPREVLVLNAAAAFPGLSGSLTVTHDAPYGVLAGRIATLEPASGFSFDTPMTARPR